MTVSDAKQECRQRLVRLARAHRREQPRVACLKVAQHERQHHAARRIEPLPVIDGEHHRPVERTQQRACGKCDDALVDRIGRVLEEQRDRERSALGRGECLELVEDRLQEIMQGGIRARRLRRRRARPQHQAPGVRDDRLEQRRLPHPRVALQERGERRPVPMDHLPQLRELLVPADDLVCDRHPATLA